MFRRTLALLLVAAAPALCAAQPFNVRAWYADGQVFVVWQFPAPPAVATDTVEIYASAAAQVNTMNMDLIGRMFYPEYTGGRLQQLDPTATLTVPSPLGGTYRLLPDEGVFAFTPHAAGNLFFAVVDTGANAVNAGNSTAAFFNYDPVNDPVRPQLQFNGFTSGGYPYSAYVLWADGSDDYDNARPDVPILASFEKNGVPHVFTITVPLTGTPTDPASCLFAIHGGGGEYELFRPGIPARANLQLELTDGIVVTPDDSIYANVEGVLARTNTSWFGYTPDFDPFTALPRTAPDPAAIVVNFTQRRVHYVLDWLLSARSPVAVDQSRVAMIGHSGGARGTSHLTRLRPERFCAVICHTPNSDLSFVDSSENFLRGDWDDNLATNLSRSDVGTLGVTDVFTLTTRLSELRDFALTRFFYGKRDEDDAATWSASQRAVVDALNDSRAGYMIFWDEREHGVEKWDDETDDATDGHPGPWPDIAQWISPARSGRAAGQYLVDTYRNDDSYPGQFNADADPVLADRQPDPGPGDPDLGDPFGTWAGYLDWDASSLIESQTRWECKLFLTGLSAIAIDNSPYSEIVMDVAPRKTTTFLPIAGTGVRWTVTDEISGVVLQSASTVAESDGLVVATGVAVPLEPERVILAFFVCPTDFDGDGDTDLSDLGIVLANFGVTSGATLADGDTDGDGDIDLSDLGLVLARFDTVCS